MENTAVVPSSAIVLEVLNQRNYKHWSFMVQNYLMSKKIWKVIKDDPPKFGEARFKHWEAKNAEALHAILISCGVDVFSIVQMSDTKKTTAKSVWDDLRKHFNEEIGSVLEDEKDMQQSADAIEESTTVVPNAIVLEVLNRRNYKQWSFMVETYLKSKKLWKVVRDDPPKPDAAEFEDWETRDAEALHAILISCGTDVFSIIHNESRTAKSAWGDLQNKFEFKSDEGFGGIRRIQLETTQLVDDVVMDHFIPYRPFMDSVRADNWDEAKKTLTSVNSRDALMARDPRLGKTKDTALHAAVRNKNVHVVKELLQLMTQEDVKVVPNKAGDTALHAAVLVGSLPIVKELVSFMGQEDLEIINRVGKLALHMAVCMSNNLDIVKELVARMRPEALEIKTYERKLALHMAVSTLNNLDVVKELVSRMRPEALEIQDADGNLPLHLAVKESDEEIVKELVQRMRVDALTIKNQRGYTAVGWALSRAPHENHVHVQMAKYMVERNRNVLAIEVPPKNVVPVVLARDKSWSKLTRYLYSQTPDEALSGPSGANLICSCFYKKYPDIQDVVDIVCDLIQRFPNLAFETDNSGRSPILQLVGNDYVFKSGTLLTFWQKWIYNRVSIEPAVTFDASSSGVNIQLIEDDECCETKDFIHSGKSWYRGLVQYLRKKLGIQRMFELKSMHVQIELIMARVAKSYDFDSKWQEKFHIMMNKSMFAAVERGRVEFITLMCKENPEILWKCINKKGRDIFGFAIECRQETIYNHMYELYKYDIFDAVVRMDKFNNNLLHIAASYSPLPRFNLIRGSFLQMQRELQWFKEVESVVSTTPEYYESSNYSDGMTPRELFTKNHKKLVEEAESAIKGIATPCTVVSSLIVTIMFSVAFTVPGGNNDLTGMATFIKTRLFTLFLVADVTSLASSATSVIIFLGVLTSRYSEEDFLKSLPTKMVVGVFSLLLSIVGMMVAFGSSLIMMSGGVSWLIPCILFSSVLVITFVKMHLPLLAQTISFTYGRSIFERSEELVYGNQYACNLKL